MTRLRSLALLGILMGLPVGGCSGFFLAGSKQGFEASQMARASFELDCPVEHLRVSELVAGAVPITPDEIAQGGHGTVIGVDGCGRRAVYKWLRGTGWIAQSSLASR